MEVYSDDEMSFQDPSKFDENSFLAMMSDMKTLMDEEKKEKEENELNLGIFLIKMDAMRKTSKKDLDFALKFLSEDVKDVISKITDIDVFYLPYFNENLKSLERISRRIEAINEEGNKLSETRYGETFVARKAEISKLEKKANDIIEDTLQKLREVKEFRYFFDKLSSNMSSLNFLNKYLEITEIPVEGTLDIILEKLRKSNLSSNQVLKTLNTSLNKAGTLDPTMENFFSLLSDFKKKIETELKTRGFNDYILKKLYPSIADIFYDYKDLLTKNLEKWIEINTIYISAIEIMIDMSVNVVGQKNTKFSIYINTLKDILQNMKTSLKGKIDFNDVIKIYQRYIFYVKAMEDYSASL
jgi:hypothetical protein